MDPVLIAGASSVGSLLLPFNRAAVSHYHRVTPLYDLHKVTVPLSLFLGGQDTLIDAGTLHRVHLGRRAFITGASLDALWMATLRDGLDTETQEPPAVVPDPIAQPPAVAPGSRDDALIRPVSGA